MANHNDTWTPSPRYPFATAEERKAGAPVDSVGHLLHLGDAMTCMCCGTDAFVREEHLRPTDEGFDYEGSQWVRTPAWVEKLRRGPEMPQCTCGANAVTVGLAGLPQHSPECALNQVKMMNVTVGGGEGSRR